jgi:hypothetical protein
VRKQSPQSTPLWPLVVKEMRRTLTHEPWGRDRARVREILWDLYLLGERPTPEEIRTEAGDGRWGREVARLWAERLRNPTRNIRERSGWHHRFVVIEGVLKEEGLPPIEDWLARQAGIAAHAYAKAISADSPEDELRRAENIFRLQTRALRVWGQTREALRHDEEIFGRLSLPRHQRIIFPRRRH